MQIEAIERFPSNQTTLPLNLRLYRAFIFKLRQGASIPCFVGRSVCRLVGRSVSWSVCPKNVNVQYFNIYLQMHTYFDSPSKDIVTENSVGGTIFCEL